MLKLYLRGYLLVFEEPDRGRRGPPKPPGLWKGRRAGAPAPDDAGRETLPYAGFELLYEGFAPPNAGRGLYAGRDEAPTL